MLDINKFLGKFSKNIQDNELNTEKISGIIEKHTQIKIKKENIEIKDYQVILKENPAVLNKIFLHKEKILEDIKILLPIKIVNIR